MTFRWAKGTRAARHQGWLLRCNGQLKEAPERGAGLPGPPPLRGPALECQHVSHALTCRGRLCQGLYRHRPPGPPGAHSSVGPEADAGAAAR